MTVSLRRSHGDLVLAVEDDGRGFDPAVIDAAEPSEGIGLVGMRERVELLGGELHIDSSPGAGARLSATLPLA